MMSEAPNNTDEELSPSVLTLDDILKRLAHLEAIVVCISVFDSLTAIALEREITRSELLRHIVETWLAATTNNGRPKVTKSKPVGFDKKSKTPTDTITELEF
ncbi:MAG: hypothetical protein JGK12_14330 [Microcoleus sp. PH2017_01_SCD_O_A]|uniref:hypothetical protein n=1 Tax=Microcoleus sp. PH2017_01_SCD_O_A TaxID=2798812 RepID=UPI001D5DF277|nr:hypothetical protein [Microcoleus sp. PH2017_01_SCD_O_A]MCC3418227.1 hypothetical protein [Microcoleus sp. PH2017_07_MST_O_A]MCC3425072.1 hypothetical protein [Microcoleus sp. PH2017_01_SCD_O_A]